MFSDLSARQQEILGYVAQGKDNKTIAREMCLSIKTVKNQLVYVFAKLGVESRTQAALAVWRQYGR